MALKTTEGVGDSMGIRDAHSDVSASWIIVSFSGGGGGLGRRCDGSRRDMVWMVLEVRLVLSLGVALVVLSRRVVRMWLPTAPVLPNINADVAGPDAAAAAAVVAMIFEVDGICRTAEENWMLQFVFT